MSHNKKPIQMISFHFVFLQLDSPWNSLSRYTEQISIMGSPRKKQLDLRQRVYDILGRMGKATVMKHRLDEEIPRSRIYFIIKRYECDLPVRDKPTKGRPPKINKKQQQ